jgi:hypothetical protein
VVLGHSFISHLKTRVGSSKETLPSSMRVFRWLMKLCPSTTTLLLSSGIWWRFPSLARRRPKTLCPGSRLSFHVEYAIHGDAVSKHGTRIPIPEGQIPWPTWPLPADP